ncbi:MAG: polysaccharide biosynthesis tyrosine autokinase [Acidimicrobiales bacterium]
MTAPTQAPTISPSMLSLSLQSYLHMLRRRRWLILGITILAGVLAALPAVLANASYSSTAQVRISTLDEEGVFRTDPSVNELPNDRVIVQLNEIEIIKSKSTRSAVEAQFLDGVPEFEDPEVDLVLYTEIVDIKIKADDPATAADVANTYANVYVEDRRSRSVQALVDKIDELRQQSSDASREIESISTQLAEPNLPPNQVTNLQVRQQTLISQVLDFDARADELSVEAALRGRGTEVVTAAELEMDPIKPSATQNGSVGLIIGLLLAMAIAVVVDTVQDRINSSDDLADVRPDLPVLASAPRFNPDALDDPSGFALREAFRYLRTGLRVRALNSPLRSILITSAISEEGKTTAAVHLAKAMAETADRVVLVDCDLRRSSLHKHFGLTNERGLTSVVVGDDSLTDVIHFIDDNLAVITAGPTVQNPTEVLSSEQFARVLDALVEQSDLTILDSPPVLPVADALIAGQHVDGIVAVCRIGAVRRRQVREMFSRLDASELEVIGMVANDSVTESPYTYYGPDPVPASSNVKAPSEV